MKFKIKVSRAALEQIIFLNKAENHRLDREDGERCVIVEGQSGIYGVTLSSRTNKELVELLPEALTKLLEVKFEGERG